MSRHAVVLVRRLVVVIAVALLAAAPVLVGPAASAQPAQDDSDTSWFGQSTLYLVFVRSFRDSDGDGTGDLQGVIDGLDYLQSLGVTTLWLMPVFRSASYHGYDTTEYTAVNPDYGDEADLIALNEAVHARGMHILIDFVFNHTSDQHPFFRDAYGNPGSRFSGWYRWRNAEQTEYDSFGGFSNLPRLNYENPEVRAFATRRALYWLDPNRDGELSDGVDGYRADAARFIPRDFWAELRPAMAAVSPGAVLLGEIWAEGQDIARYLKGDGLHAAFDFPVYHALLGPNTEVDGQNVLAGTADPSPAWLNMRSLPRLVAPESVLVRFTNNHDTNRVMSKIEDDMARARAAAVWLLTVPGVPLIYYGEEIGMRGEKGTGPYFDEFRREPLDWYANEEGPGMAGWFMPSNGFNEPNDGVSVEEEDGVPGSLLEFYRAMGMLREQHAALHNSSLETYDIQRNTPLYVLRRWNDTEMFLVVINFTAAPQTLTGFRALAEVEGAGSFDPGSMNEIISQGVGWPSSETDSLAVEAAGFAVYRFTRTP